MSANIENMQKFNKGQIEAVTAASAAMTKGMQNIADETTASSKKFFEASSSAFQDLASARDLEKAIEIQTTFAKETQNNFLAQTTKLSEIYFNLAKEMTKPFLGAFAGKDAEPPTAPPVVPIKPKAA